MCGICGKVILDPRAGTVDPLTIHAMMERIVHRGPDDSGIYLSGSIGLGHRRLSIIDLSAGKQPISNEDGTVWVTYNGEIYNYRDLRSQLIAHGHRFRTATDTETIVHLYEEYGLRCVEKLSGMFSFALWDDKRKLAMIARDRVGIKPLYYCITQGALIFASEIKSILADPSVTPEANPAALDLFLSYRYVPGDQTSFKGIRKLLPGHYLVAEGGRTRLYQYWDLHFTEPGPQKRSREYETELCDLLSTTVRDHMIADVPVGVLLSGGVDSTAMLSFAAEHSGKQISTFTVGFGEPGIPDERPYARLAATRYGTRHCETTVTSRQFLEWLPSYVWHMEEPVCEPPAIALYYITKYAREQVTVLISGEGGDEAFAGYQNYRSMFWIETLKASLGSWTTPASWAMSGLGRVPGLARFERYAPLLSTRFENYYFSRTASPFWAFNNIKRVLYTGDFQQQIQDTRNGASEYVRQCIHKTEGLNPLDRMLYVDTKTWLPDDLLIKADKMTMANSLELRVPLLDHRVLEFAASLPRAYKLRGLSTKYLFKKAMASRVPAAIRHRRKAGFPVPYRRWIRNDFRDVITTLLTERRAVERGYFKKTEIEQLLSANANGVDRSEELFCLAILELWHRAFIDRAAADDTRTPCCPIVTLQENS
jgi:asparagine synthase (glutamine-hydrolysing)